MTPAARAAAAIEVLDDWLSGTPAEKALTGWARSHRFAGSKDRAAIRDLTFDAIRRRRSAAAVGGAETGRGLILGLLRQAGTDPAEVFNGVGHAPAPLSDGETVAGRAEGDLAPEVRCDCPDWLWSKLGESLGDDREAVLLRLRERAPTDLRANLARTDRGGAVSALREEGFKADPGPLSDTAIRLDGAVRGVRSTRAFAEGLIEFQDAASQAVVDAVLAQADPATILDYCAGGGGKALALAARTGHPVLVHDAAPRRMKDIPVRAARAGVALPAYDGQRSVDLVFVDAPCSGSGAWRRQPEGKWLLTDAGLRDLTTLQAAILDEAADLVAPGGHLAYVTCSILRDENEATAAGFLARHASWQTVLGQRFSPLDGGDGFFLSLFRRGGDRT